MRTIHVAIALSLLLHACLLLTLPIGGSTEEAAEDKKSGDSVSVKLLPPTKPDLPKETKEGVEQGAKVPTISVCNPESRRYRGIGLLYSLVTGTVLEAPAGYPASQAGIRVGDVLYDQTEPDAEGYVTYHLLRDAQKLDLRIKLEQICYSGDDK